jgi:hypothetical protein
MSATYSAFILSDTRSAFRAEYVQIESGTGASVFISTHDLVEKSASYRIML